MTRLLATFMAFWARRYIGRTGVRLVAVTGSVGKTTTKEAIGAALSESQLRVRTVAGNMNVSFGVPLGIMGGGWDERYRETGGGPVFWLRAACAAPFRALFASADADIVVLEYGADRPGDIAWLSGKFPPHIAVVTAIGDIPVHVEFYESPQHLAAEKANILKGLRSGDHAILCADDAAVVSMRENVGSADVTTFGMSEEADVRADDVTLISDEGEVEGVVFALTSAEERHEVRIYGALGRSQATACAAAYAVAMRLGVPMAAVFAGFAAYRPPAGRMRLIRGIKHTTIIDDSYNASPAAVQNALDALAAVPAQRRIAVLGDMLELGGSTIRAHEGVGNRAGNVVTILIAVGDRSRFIADAAGNQMPRESIHWFRTAREAGLKLQEVLEPGDLVLIKGSQGMRMERVVLEVMADPGRAGQLLVRQGPRWLQKA